jgi:putative ABC transport system ATP-binding protein
MPVAVSVRGLRKAFGTGAGRVEALAGIDLDVAPGEFLALTGPSGSGKSTLLHLIAGLDEPDGGLVWVGGTDLAGLDEDGRALMRREKIGIVFQSFNLLDVFTAEENVALPLALAGCPSRAASLRSAAALDRVGLGHRRAHRPAELSGGEQQRVAVARALVIEPVLLLADEPTGSLDSDAAARVIDLLRGLADERRRAIVLVTHDPAQAARADREVRMSDGRLAGETHDALGLRIARVDGSAGPVPADGRRDRGRGGDGRGDLGRRRGRAA